MAHTICDSTQQPDSLAYCEHLFSELLNPELDLRTKLEAVFRSEVAEFDLSYAFLTRIDRAENVQYIQVAHGNHDGLQAGRVAPLSESYCRRTIAEPDGTKRISDARSEGLRDTPEYDRFGLDTYLGATVEVDGELYGTLCFASSEARDDPITDREVNLLRILSQWVSYELQLWDAPAAPGIDATLEEELFSPETDRALQMLSAPERRLILLHLFTGTLENESELPIPTTDPVGVKTDLRHNHLPKLNAAGYVEWDQSTGDLARGPQFSDVEPFLDLLVHYCRHSQTV